MPSVRRDALRTRSHGRIVLAAACALAPTVTLACSLTVGSDGLTGGLGGDATETRLDAAAADAAHGSQTDAPDAADGAGNSGNANDGSSDATLANVDAADDANVMSDGSSATTYASAVLASGPIAYWHFDETAGVVAASAVNERMYEGAYEGAITLGVPPAFGAGADNAAALRLNGVDNNASGGVLIGNVFAFANNVPFTFEFWYRPILIDSVYRQLFSHTAGASNYALFAELSSTSPDDLFFAASPVSSPTYANSAFPLPIGQWLYMVVTYDGTSLLMYKNASLIASKSMSVTGSFDGGDGGDAGVAVFYIGCDSITFNELDGDLDEFAVYDKALGTDVITAHYAAAQPEGISDAGTDADAH